MLVRLLLFASVLLLLVPARAHAQLTSRPTSAFWIEAGLGGGVASRDGYGLSGHADARLRRGSVTYAGRLSATSGGPSQFEGLFFDYVSDEFFEAAVLVGLSPVGTATGGFVVEAGPALVWGNRVVPENGTCSGWCSDFDRVDVRRVLGLSLGAGIEGDVWPALGYSLRVHANLNREQPFAGLTLGVRLGALR